MKKLLFAMAVFSILLAGCGVSDTDKTTEKSPTIIGEITVEDGDFLRRDIIPQLSQVFGLTTKEVKEALSEAGKGTDYYDKVKDYRSFEGVMLPGKYKVYEGDTLSRFLTDCLKDFNKTVKKTATKVTEKNDLTRSQQVVLASIIQAECLEGEYLEQTSTVFQNRILANSRLQSCVTAEYALGYQRPFLTGDDVAIESPYNTYYANGLPPGPICSFSLDCLKAAVREKMDSDIYYFYYDYLAGEMHFYDDYTLFRKAASKSLEEFTEQSDIGARDKINKQKLYTK